MAATIGVLGAGRMAAALSAQWLDAGHRICIAGRTPEKASQLADKLGSGCRSGSFRETVAFGELLLIAVRHEGVMETLAKAGARDGAFAGKVLIDCSNPVNIDDFTLAGNAHDSLAERIQSFTGAKVVKAFNLCEAQVWEMAPPVFDGRPLVVPFSADDDAAAEAGAELITAVGCEPMRLGPLLFARHLEAMAAIVISRLFGGEDSHAVFNWIRP